MKILLIYPHVSSSADVLTTLEPLGLEYIAAPLLDGHDVEILDLRVSKEPVTKALVRSQPDIVGISGVSLHAYEMLSLSQTVKNTSPRAKVIVGGRHATFVPDFFRVPTVDIIVKYEAESIMTAIVASIHSADKLSKIPGILYRFNDKWSENPGWQTVEFNKLAPAHHLVNQFANGYQMLGVKTRMVQMSRGCPYSCSFCDARRFFHGRYQWRDVYTLIEEIASLETRFIYTADENIGIRKDFLAAVAYSLIENKVDKKFWLTMSAKEVLVHRQLLDTWFEAGLSVVFTGFERPEDKSILALGKSTTVSINDQVISYVHSRNGIIVGSFLVLPTDTEKDFRRLEEYIHSREVDVPLIFILTPYPGTDIWEASQETINRDFTKYDFMHSVLPTILPQQDFYRYFYSLYKNVNVPHLVLRMIKKIGIGKWLLLLPRTGLKFRGVLKEGMGHENIAGSS